MYNESQGDQRRRSSDGLRAIASQPSTPHFRQHMSYPTYLSNGANPDHASERNGGDNDYVYEERVLGANRDLTESHRALSDAPYRGSPNAARSSYSSPADLRMSRIYSGGQHSITSAPPAIPPYRMSAYHSDEVPGAFPYHQNHQINEQYDQYYPPPPSCSHGYFAASPMHDESQPNLFEVNANHHRPGHYDSRPEEMLPSFPKWSRTWYDGHLSSNGHAYTTVAPPPGHSSWETDSYSKHGYHGGHRDRYGPGPHEHQDMIREERLKMLEKEFGKPRVHHREGQDDCSDNEFDVDEPLPLGSVTSTGRLITERPKTVIILRVIIAIVALAGFGCGLGGALLVKTSTTDKPAPKGTLPAYLLYGCSTITLVLLLYLYVFRPCCCDPMRKELKATSASGNPLAGMVIPVLTGGANGAQKKKKFGKKDMMQQQQQQAPTVNLIVDPSFLTGVKGEKCDSEDDYDERLPGDARRSKKRKHGLGVLGNMQMQRRWQLARSRVKLYTTWDVILLLVWIGCDVVSLGLGKKCPATAGSWCTYYNAAIACGVIIAVLFSVAIYFDYRDLKVSRNAPKPPM